MYSTGSHGPAKKDERPPHENKEINKKKDEWEDMID